MPSSIDVCVRSYIIRDFDQILEIEKESFDFPWTEKDFAKCRRQSKSIILVAECENVIYGYVCYELHDSSIHLTNLAVHPAFRRSGVGTAMLNKVKSRISTQRQRCLLSLNVRESNLVAQQFLKSQDFKATEILKKFFENEDAYWMEFSPPSLVPCKPSRMPQESF